MRARSFSRFRREGCRCPRQMSTGGRARQGNAIMQKRRIVSAGRNCAEKAARAFSSEVETGSRQENASNQNLEPRFDSIETEKALAMLAADETRWSARRCRRLRR